MLFWVGEWQEGRQNGAFRLVGPLREGVELGFGCQAASKPLTLAAPIQVTQCARTCPCYIVGTELSSLMGCLASNPGGWDEHALAPWRLQPLLDTTQASLPSHSSLGEDCALRLPYCLLPFHNHNGSPVLFATPTLCQYSGACTDRVASYVRISCAGRFHRVRIHL